MSGIVEIKKACRVRMSACAIAMVFGVAGGGVAKSEPATARGLVKAVAEATIAMDYAARIRSLPKREGEAFRKGDTLIAFDCRKFNAEISAAKATARARQLKMSNNRKLLARGAMGANEVRISEAEFSAAQAEVQALQARTGSCDFKAPFDGLLVERIRQEHEIPSANEPVIRIVDTSRLEVETIVPSRWLGWLRPGATFTFRVEETGAELRAEVSRLGAVVDPVSQTVKAYGTLIDIDHSVLPGMSGTATFANAGS